MALFDGFPVKARVDLDQASVPGDQTYLGFTLELRR